ncbi:hypothetical protein Hanom_Chr10g00925661 [Helianthus anomalus]
MFFKTYILYHHSLSLFYKNLDFYSVYPYNCGFVPPCSSADTNQTTNPSQPVSPVPTRPTPYRSDFVEYN